MDSLHVHVGVLAQIAVALVLRRRLSSIWPWLAVAAAVLANEAYDYRYETWPTRSDQVREGAKDLWNTMLLPTVLLLLARYAPGLFRAAPSADAGKTGEEWSQAGK
jgi:hypothetical protein